MDTKDEELATTIQTYNEIVEPYYENTSKLASSKEVVDEFSKMLPKGAKILDAGCGPGRDAKWFTDKGFDVVGIDLAEKMIEFARKIAPKATFKIMDFRKLDFPDKSFDAIWFSSSLLSIKKNDAPGALREMYRTLKKGGVMFLNSKVGEGEGLQKDNRYGGKSKFYAYYKLEEVKQLAEDAGFSIIKSFDKKDERYDDRRIIILFCRK